MYLILSCEHAGNKVPKKLQYLFKNQKKVLNTHRGLDIGALEIAKVLAKELRVPLFFNTHSRLLIELNRSLHHPNLFSEFSKVLPKNEQEKLIKNIYQPYREEVINAIHQSKKPVIHLSVHSFTPIFDGEVREAELGLLYDSRRSREKKFASRFKKQLQEQLSMRIRMNYPYLGKADGLTTALRKSFKTNEYLGIELEINQKIYTMKEEWKKLIKALVTSLNRYAQ